MIKTIGGINFPESVKENVNLNRSGIIKMPENNSRLNEADDDLSIVNENIKKMKMNSNLSTKINNEKKNPIENDYLNKKTEENKESHNSRNDIW